VTADTTQAVQTKHRLQSTCWWRHGVRCASKELTWYGLQPYLRENAGLYVRSTVRTGSASAAWAGAW
jgi:hypothetical protein